jgi:hypothetical protein
VLRIRIHLTNGDCPEVVVRSLDEINEIRDEIDDGRWLNFANTRFIRGKSVDWIEVVDDAPDPADGE